MPQVHLPIFPRDVKYINSNIGVQTRENNVYYFNGMIPIYHHHADDYKSFRYITSQMVVLGNAKQVEIVKTFKVSKESVKRWVKTYRTKGGTGFFETRKINRRGRVLDDQTKIIVQGMLNRKKTLKEIEQELGIKQDTLRKAIKTGRLQKIEGEIPIEPQASKPEKIITKSDRSIADSQAPMGMGATNTAARIDATLKKK